MCGVAGLMMTEDRGLDGAAAVRRMTQRMAARGPDAEGFWSDGRAGVFLGHRRLSIIDLDRRSDQPMISSSGRSVIVFNGEIYNFRSLREELEQAGVVFATGSDTEVILALVEREGIGALRRLRGMFALAIWDRQRRDLLLARDPYGIKPLYVARVGGAVLFASQVKALLASGAVAATLAPAGLAGFYLWGSVPEPFTLYREITEAPAGGWIRIAADGAETRGLFADIADAWSEPQAEAAHEPVASLVRRAVSDSIRAHMVGDVPISAFLSGGVDSAAIAAHAAEQGHRLQGITIAFPEFRGGADDETPMARATACRHRLGHTVREIGIAEFRADLPALLEAMDQPSIDGVNTWFAAKAAAESGYKVALSGVGGDELFRGYSTFQRVPSLARAGRALSALGPLRPCIGPILGALSGMTRQPKLRAMGALSDNLVDAYLLQRGLYLPDDLAELMGAAAARDGLEELEPVVRERLAPRRLEPAQAVGVLESSHYLRNQLLRDADWASMAHSIELRTPLVDAALLTALAPHGPAFAGGAGKQLLGVSSQPPLPQTLIERRKTGFSVPLSHWLSDTGDDSTRRGLSMGKGWSRRWALRIAAAFLGESPIRRAA
ncbi:MAG TPA: asparagine synthase (glutamine-hydrolyzing) [Caulobacteraceae bacterium]|jgi:asparagine synthase (glutamine-hydrolysing)|nr:asparagine synthase (glutamine-hydrolyzing) [Caulobacteraceae bacterium]